MSKTFSAWSEELCQAINQASQDPYEIEVHGYGSEDFGSLTDAVNQGIDSHLEAIHFKEFPGFYRKRGFRIEPQSVSVLVRRLMESDNDNSHSLASSICQTLGIELI